MAPLLSPEELLEQLSAWHKTPPSLQGNDELRKRLLAKGRQVLLDLEDPFDYSSRLLCIQNAEHALVRVGLDLKLFISVAEGPKTADKLAAETGAELELMQRVLRGLAAFGAVAEEKQGAYSLPARASFLAQPAFADAFAKCLDFLVPVYQAIPSALASLEYRNPTDSKNTVVQKAYGMPGTDQFGILMQRPESLHGFGILMHTWGQFGAQLHEVYPVMERLSSGFSTEHSDVMLVDVGGGFGQKAQGLKQAFPELPGRLVCQDTEQVIGQAPPNEQVELTAHDFFKPQPIKGARAYYIRQTLHNWNDAACVDILSNLAAAMAPGYSKVIIHELVMPAQGVPPWTAMQDMNMMGLLATLERSEAQWRDVVAKAGLRVTGVFHARDGVSESAIECGLA